MVLCSLHLLFRWCEQNSWTNKFEFKVVDARLKKDNRRQKQMDQKGRRKAGGRGGRRRNR